MQNLNKPFFPEDQKLLHTLPPIEGATLKGVIGALTWAEFKMDGGQNSIPKESKLIQDFPPKTSPQVQPGESISEHTTLPKKDGKGFFGLKD